MSDIKAIRNRDDYNEAIALLADLIEANPAVGTPEDIKVRILTDLIENFEDASHKIAHGSTWTQRQRSR